MVGLYQFGIIRTVPEPLLPGLDADAVDAADEAYALLHTPDISVPPSIFGALCLPVTAAFAAGTVVRLSGGDG